MSKKEQHSKKSSEINLSGKSGKKVALAKKTRELSPSNKSKKARGGEKRKISLQKDQQKYTKVAKTKPTHSGLTTPVLRKMHNQNGTTRTGKDVISGLRAISLNEMQKITRKSALFASSTGRKIVRGSHVECALRSEKRPKLQLFVML